jgi:hydroxymethylbilane synthase
MPMKSHAPLRIATRKSKLARWQSDFIAAWLRREHPGLQIEIVEVVTTGDQVRDRALSEIGERGLFTKELERVLLEGGADIAVHSLKDMETTLPEGLEILTVPERADPRDAWVSRSGTGLTEIPPGSRIGTSSLRRRAQILAMRPDLVFEDMRGNVPTRLDKVARGEGGVEATVLACAGLERLGLSERATAIFDPELLLPAVSQGALGIEGAGGDPRLRELLAPLEHRPTRQAVRAERAFLRQLRGGCQVPAGALARVEEDTLTLDGIVCALDGSANFRDRTVGLAEEEAESLGVRLAETLITRGADRILAEVESRFRAAAASSERPERAP